MTTILPLIEIRGSWRHTLLTGCLLSALSTLAVAPAQAGVLAPAGSPAQTAPYYPYTGPVFVLLNGAGAPEALAMAGQTLQAFPSSVPATMPETWRNWRYQWLRNGIPIEGQTAATLTVGQEGRYSFRVQYNKISDPQSGVVTLTSEEIQVYQGPGYNQRPATYSTTTAVLTPGLAQTSQLTTLAVENKQQVATLVDGFGRTLQTQVANAAPNQADLLSFQSYDNFGEVPKTYLPFTRTTTSGAFRFSSSPLSEQSAFYNGSTNAVAADARPYSTAVVEASPLGRPLAQYRPGTAWQSNPASVQYATNPTNSVHRWNGLDGSGFYAVGTLAKVVQTDADSRVTETYYDQAGRLVLTRRTGATPTETYNVYDEAGRLRYVVPPAATAVLSARNNYSISATSDAAFIRRWLYEYQYDATGRLMKRWFPGAAPVSFVYDRHNRPVLTQDGNRAALNQWFFTKYDAKGRTIVEGLYTDARGQTVLQAEADNWGSLAGQRPWERRQNPGSYTLTESFPNAGTLAPLAINWYEDYDLDLDGTDEYIYAEQTYLTPAEQPKPAASATGRATIVLKRVLLSDGTLSDWLRTALFYDKYGNVIQKQGTTILNDLSDPGLMPNVTTLVYRAGGFVPQVLQTIKAQQTDEFGSVVVRNRFAYDHAGRLKSVWQQNHRGGQPEPEVLVAQFNYNALGQLIEKNLHSKDGGLSFLQSVDLRYNIHGDLVSFNNSELLPNASSDEANDLFGFALARQAPDPGLSSTPRFDGGISAVRWQARNPVQHNQPERERGYAYSYDGLGRLTQARFRARDASAGSGFNTEVGAYDETSAYDPNGNTTSLSRNAQTGAAGQTQYSLDALTYNYGPDGGNQLQAVTDGGNPTKGFRDLVNTSKEYFYDANGALTQDNNKGLTLSYNVLNKVAIQTTTDGGKIYSDFDAAGILLRRTVVPASGSAATYYYADGFVYENSLRLKGLAALPTPAGRAVVVTSAAPAPYQLQPAAGPTIPAAPIPATPSPAPAQPPYEGPGRLVYEYHLRDQQGNLRLAFRAEQAPRWLRLAMEDVAAEEGTYPKFENVASTRVLGTIPLPAQQNSYYATVSATQPGPATTLPVAHGDVVKVSFYYRTPAGVQYRTASPAPVAGPKEAASLLRVAPMLLAPLGANQQSAPTEPAKPQLRPYSWLAGVQLSLSGLLSSRASGPGSPQLKGGPVQPPAEPRYAYLRWELSNEQGQVQQSGTLLAPATTASTNGWVYLSATLPAADLASMASRTGRLRLQLLNDGGQSVHFDSLTVRHPQPALLVSQEQHYYPFGLAMQGVAVNTIPAEAISKAQYNDGSLLQDELLGEAANYTTHFRQYDPTLGRFMAVDPLAGEYADRSTYHYGNNDPVNHNDPTGAWYLDAFHNVRLVSGRGIDTFGNAYGGFGSTGLGGDGGSAGGGGDNPFAGNDPNRGGFIHSVHNPYNNGGAADAYFAAQNGGYIGNDGKVHTSNGSVFTLLRGYIEAGDDDAFDLKDTYLKEDQESGNNNPFSGILAWANDNSGGAISFGGGVTSITGIATSAIELTKGTSQAHINIAKSLGKKVGFAGLALTLAGAAVEYKNGSWDTHTLVDIGVGFVATAALFATAPVCLTVGIIALGYTVYASTHQKDIDDFLGHLNSNNR